MPSTFAMKAKPQFWKRFSGGMQKHLEADRQGQIGVKLKRQPIVMIHAYQIDLVMTICRERYSAQLQPMSSLGEKRIRT